MIRRCLSTLCAVTLAGLVGRALAQDAPPSTVPPINPVPQATGQPAPYEDPARGSTIVWQESAGASLGTIYAGAAFYMLQPNFETNPAYLISSTIGTPVPTFSERQVDFTYDLDGAPEIYLGYLGAGGGGLRLRYFEYAHGSSDQFAFVAPGGDVSVGRIASASPLGVRVTEFGPADGDLFAFFSTLNILVFDLEASQSWYGGNWTLTAGGGLRYAHLSQNYSAYYQGTNGTDVDTDVLKSGHNFNGAGPTLFVEGSRGLGGFGLGIYGNARLAMLFGTAKSSVFSTPDELIDVAEERFQQQADFLPVGELEIGAELNRDLGPFRVRLQTGLVGHGWFGAGNAAQVDTTFTSSGSIGAFEAPAGGNVNLGLIGFVVRGELGF